MTTLSIIQHKEAPQQYIDFASKTKVKLTDDDRKNLTELRERDRISPSDICSWTELYGGAPRALQTGNLQSISFEKAAIINARAGRTIIELDLKHIDHIFVNKSATTILKGLVGAGKMNFSSIASEIKMPKVSGILSKVLNGTAIKVDTQAAIAIDDYFNNEFQTKLFDVNDFFTRTKVYLESTLQNVSPNIKTPEPANQTKRLLEYAEENQGDRSKRRKFSTETVQEPNSTNNNSPQFNFNVIPFHKEAEQLSDPLESGLSVPRQSDDGFQYSFNTNPPRVMEENHKWDSFNIGETLIQPELGFTSTELVSGENEVDSNSENEVLDWRLWGYDLNR